MNKKIGIIGAGPAGLTSAYILSKKGFDVTVFEEGDQVGGMAKTILLWDQLVDLGPHRFFSNDTRVNSIWLDVIGIVANTECENAFPLYTKDLSL